MTHRTSTRERFRRVIFDSDTPAGRAFDVWLLAAILLSCALVMLDSVREARQVAGTALRWAEWAITLLFSVEYLLRVWCSPNRMRYMLSFYGIVDLLAIVPTYLSALVPGTEAMALVRVLRVVRVFRVLNLVRYVREARLLLVALLASRHRIIVFMLAVMAIVTVFGAIMYVVEPHDAGFTSIPRSIYWAIVTLTTVGYGDIAPVTTLGQAIASVIMILGYAIIAIPTGIVTVELGRQVRNAARPSCPRCAETDHLDGARFCHKCGARLAEARS